MYNFFDFISFPNREQRDVSRAAFFDTIYLRIDEEIITDSINAVKGIRGFSEISKLKTKVMNFNNTVVYLDLAILQMTNYYQLLNNSTESQKRDIYEVLYRQACRNVGCEIYVYEEKIKDILRPIIMRINGKKKSYKEFMPEFKKACGGVPYRLAFLDAVEAYHNEKNVNAIRKLRNDEVHNESNLFINYKDDNKPFNENLFEKIQLCLRSMIVLKAAFQTFLISYLKEACIKY